MAMMDASALVYCWTLLEIEQPSFGATRSLFVLDRSREFMPSASSHQLRVFGAFSRRLREGMMRVGAQAEGEGLLATAYEGTGSRRTIVMLNRSVTPLLVHVAWPGARFTWEERVTPYDGNVVRTAPAGPVSVQPGEIVTLTNVPLGKVGGG
jgi:hypothetical protein